MGKVRLRKRRLRRLSLKWSFFFYAAVAVLAALAAIMLLTAICSELQNGLYHRWETRYGAQYRIPAQLVVDGEVVGDVYKRQVKSRSFLAMRPAASSIFRRGRFSLRR